MVLPQGWSSLQGISQIYRRIKAIDSRIDSIEGKSQVNPSDKLGAGNVNSSPMEGASSFAQVLGEIRENLPPRANRWIVEDALQRASLMTGIDLDLIKAVVQVESGGNPRAVSSVGAKGLMQLIDSTAASLGVCDPFDPHQNALGGAKYLKEQLQRFGGNLKLALAAYNAGPQAVQKHGGIPPYEETINYVSKVEAAYRAIKNGQKTS